MHKERMETVKKKGTLVVFYFIIVYLLAQYPVVTGTDLFVLLMLISYIAVLMFVAPWSKLEAINA